MKKKLVLMLILLLSGCLIFSAYAEDTAQNDTDNTIEESQDEKDEVETLQGLIDELEERHSELQEREQQLKDTFVIVDLTEEQELAAKEELAEVEEELAKVIEELDSHYDALTILETEQRIEEIKAKLEDEESELTEEEREELQEELVKLEEELTEILDEKEEAEGSNPNALRFEQAEELGITPGKMRLLERLQEYCGEEDVNLEEWAERSPKEINMEIKKERMTQKFGVDEDGNVKIGNGNAPASVIKSTPAGNNGNGNNGNPAAGNRGNSGNNGRGNGRR